MELFYEKAMAMKYFPVVIKMFSIIGIIFKRKYIKQLFTDRKKSHVSKSNPDIASLYVKNYDSNLIISEEKYSKAFHASPHPISITTLADGKYIEINESYANQMGCKRKDLLGRYSYEIKLFPYPDERRRMTKKLAAHGKLTNYPVNYYTKVSGIRKCLVNAEIIELQGELCMLAVITDITDKIRMELEILKISERERIRIGQDLHDDLGQHLIGIEAMSVHLANSLKNKSKNESLLARKIILLIRQATDKTRRMSRGLYPVVIEEKGLISVLEDLTSTMREVFNIECTLNYKKPFHIHDITAAIHVYHIAQECVTNSVKHGKATSIKIELKSDKKDVNMNINDNGCGFSPDQKSGDGIGLSIMQYRARKIGAELEIVSNKECGTTVNLRIPRFNNNGMNKGNLHE